MRTKLKLDGPLVGYAATSANAHNLAAGEVSVDIVSKELITTENGNHLIRQLDNLSEALLFPAGLNAKEIASIERFLAIMKKDGSVDLYINEPDLILSVQLKMNVEKLEQGQPVGFDAIEHITTACFRDVHIPPDSGFMWVFSFGWRKGYLFDLSPLVGWPDGTQAPPRDYDIATALADSYSYLMNQEMLNTDLDTWQELFRQDWFPFLILPENLRRALIAQAREHWPIEQIEDKIESFLRENIKPISKVLLASKILDSHRVTVARALEQFINEDYISSIHILVPRIEGLMRELYARSGIKDRPRQGRLISNLLKSAQSVYQQNSPAIPDRFAEYLEKVFFEDFPHDSPAASDIVSRHTLLHGVAAERHLNKKTAMLSIMTLMQIVSYSDRLSNKPTAQIVI